MPEVPHDAGVWLGALLIVVGTIGIVVPVLPGLLVVLGGVLLWAFSVGTTTAWTVFAVALVWFAAGVGLQYLVPGRRMRANGVGVLTLMLAVVAGIIGFVVFPVLGAPLGFVGGIFVIEAARSRPGEAWARTKLALRAVAQSMGIELLAALAIGVTFLVGVLLT